MNQDCALWVPRILTYENLAKKVGYRQGYLIIIKMYQFHGLNEINELTWTGKRGIFRQFNLAIIWLYVYSMQLTCL
jgi:hypothetical protein